MKAYISRARFDEYRRFTAVREQMGRVRLDADANEQADLVRTDARRRSGDVAEGSPDDGFRVADTHLLDPIYSTEGWRGEGLLPDDERVIPRELHLVRRDPDTLPHVIRVRGYTQVVRTLPEPVDLLHLPIPLDSDRSTYEAAVLVLPVRFERPPTDDEVVDVRVLLLDVNGDAHSVLSVEALSDQWSAIRVPLSDLAPLPTTTLDDGSPALFITGWGLQGLPPRAEVYFDALLAEDAGLGEDDFILRGGDGTLARAGRLYVRGWRTFLEHDWRYSLQPDLRNPEPLQVPPDPEDWHYLAYVDLWERPVHAFQDHFLSEPALDGDDTTFRSQKVTQIRIRQIHDDTSEDLHGPIGGGRLSTNIPAGALPDRFPPEEPDPCRDRCLFTENVSTGEGYRGSENIHVRIEILRIDGPNPIVGWSRNNAATVAALTVDAVDGAESVVVDPADAAHFMAGDIVVVEDEWSRLDPDHDGNRCALRRLRAVDTATGTLEFHETGHLLTSDPDDLDVGGPLQRSFRTEDRAAVRRWDSADWLLVDVRYNFHDGITFSLTGSDFRVTEYWSFTARIANSDGSAHGTVQQLQDAPVHGPWHERVPLARIRWTSEGRTFEDLRLRFLPLHEVRDRLIELGRRNLAPGAFTVVVGDGERTFGDIDQNLAEGVTGDEALQAALDRLGPAGGTIYIRAGRYRLEHPVLLQARSNVRILGDGDASELRVTGAGGAFYVDWCGHEGNLVIELLHLVEAPEEETPIGLGSLAGGLDGSLVPPPGSPGGVGDAEPLRPSDIQASTGDLQDVLRSFSQQLAALRPGQGRAAASVVRTIIRLRRLQRENPGRSLEDIAADELSVLRSLPHGVVTVTDSSRVSLRRLTLDSREEGRALGVVAAGVLVSGTLSQIEVSGCRVRASSGIVAAPYGRFLNPLVLVNRPRSGLFARSISVAGNELLSRGAGSFGIRIAEGVLEGVTVTGNQLDGFPAGISIEDRAELRRGEAVDRTVVRDNQILGADHIGIRINGDGVDAEANEVRLAPGDGPFLAGVQVTGTGNRIRETWISLPNTSSAPQLGLTAGIVIGSGRDGGELANRPVHDLEISNNRVEGAGETGFASGLLLGGSQPIYDVRIRGNSLRNLGDAGIRAWANGGAIGGLQIEGNRIEGVARAFRSWGPAVLEELTQLVPAVAASLAANASPREAMEALLNQAGDVRIGIDGMLRWLESATLRGGILLSLVEESQVRNNRILDIGSRQLPSNFQNPGAEIRTAGIGLAGGRDVTVEGNQVERVLGAVQSIPVGPIAPVEPTPPIFNFLDRLRLTPPLRPPTAEDIHGATIALRRDLMAYAQGNSSVRQRFGRSIYAAMESVQSALERQGPQARQFARELTGGIDEMLEAQGAADHTDAANHVRAILSSAASVTADDDAVAEIWTIAGRYDHALLGSEDDIVAAATEISENAPRLLEGLEDIDPQLQEKAEAVIARQGRAATRQKARLALAAALGTVAEARDRKLAFTQAIPEGGISATEGTIVEGMVRLSLDAVGADDAVELNAEELKRLEQGTTALADTLSDIHQEFGEKLRRDFREVKKSGGSAAADVTRLRATLSQIEEFAKDPDSGTRVRESDLQSQQRRFNAELVILTAQQLDHRVGGLALEAESGATRNLLLLKKSVGQLEHQVASEPSLVALAKDVDRAVADAISDVANRDLHQETARQKLQELQQEQGRIAGVGLRTSKKPSIVRSDAERLAGLGQLLLELPKIQDADLRRRGTSLFEGHARRAVEELDLRSSEREGILRSIPAAVETLTTSPPPETEAAAVHVLACALDGLSGRAGKQRNASPQTKAVRVLNGALVRLLDPNAEEADRLTTAQRWVAANQVVLASSTASAFNRASTVLDARTAIFAGLAGLTRVRPVPIPPPSAGPRLRPHPADGVLAAGVQSQLDLLGNQVESVRLGLAITGPSGHVLAPVDEAAGATIAVQANRITGGTIGAMDFRTEYPVFATVQGNHAMGCNGLDHPTSNESGQAVVRISGEGELAVTGNHLHDNGSRGVRELIHELVVDWRGDSIVQDNRIRSRGGQLGGAGLMITAEDVSADLVRSLARLPALTVEPPPDRPEEPDDQPIPGISDFLIAGLDRRTGVFHGQSSFGVGSFRLATRDQRPSYARLEAAQPAEPARELAADHALTWLAQSTPMLVYEPMFEFLRRLPPPLLIPTPQVRRAVHVSGNDVVSAGPALLLLADGAVLVSATVVGNDFESSTGSGAAYLRNLDTTIFASNRCECLSAVSVVVVRAGPSLVSVTGNAVIGAEPPAPPRPPIRPFKPDLSHLGDLHLAFDLGSGSALTLKLDETAVLNAIEQRKDRAFQDVVEEAEVSYNLFAKQAQLMIDPDVRAMLASGAAHRFVRFDTAETGLVREPAAAEAVDRASEGDASSRDAEVASAEVLARTLATSNIILKNPELSNPAKLFGMATQAGYSPHQARKLVQSQIAATGGVHEAALVAGLRVLTGVEDVGPTVAERLDQFKIMEEIVGLVLRNKDLLDLTDTQPEPERESPPDPQDHSVIIIGGSRVGAINNVTTAGVHIHDAKQSIENNL